jgi:pyruvate/2-oxoglutarate dehydrogenase complex dihydrolipoamide acyltransferase (E2) component
MSVVLRSIEIETVRYGRAPARRAHRPERRNRIRPDGIKPGFLRWIKADAGRSVTLRAVFATGADHAETAARCPQARSADHGQAAGRRLDGEMGAGHSRERQADAESARGLVPAALLGQADEDVADALVNDLVAQENRRLSARARAIAERAVTDATLEGVSCSIEASALAYPPARRDR